LRDGLLDRFLHLRRLGATPFEPAFDDFFFAGPFPDAVGVGLGPSRKIFERGDDALEFGVEVFVFELRQLSQCHLENVAVRPRRDRQLVFVIRNEKDARFEAQFQFAALEDASVLIA
jgi:hypothetical protein